MDPGVDELIALKYWNAKQNMPIWIASGIIVSVMSMDYRPDQGFDIRVFVGPLVSTEIFSIYIEVNDWTCDYTDMTGYMQLLVCNVTSTAV